MDRPGEMQTAGELEQSSPGFSYPGKDGETIEMSNAVHDALVDKIVRNFVRFDKAKNPVRKRWKETERAVRGAVSSIESERSNALVPYGKQSHQTLISHFWGRSLQNDDILFSIEGKDDESKNTAPTQKEHILDILKADLFQQKMDDGVDDALMKGVVIGHVGYNEAKQTIQVLSGYKGTQQEVDENGAIQFTTMDETLQDSATLTIVDPEDFVFDTTNHQNWDACFKAFRSFKIFEDIEVDPDFSNYAELENLTADKVSGTDKYFPTHKSKQKQGSGNEGVDDEGKIELIEFHGDIRLADGTYLRNWTIVIGGRKKVIRFEQNRIFINPFQKWTYERTKDGWGIAPISHIIKLIEAGSTMLNTSVEAGKQAINPPLLAPKGMLPQKRLYLTEGRVIEYTPNSTMPNIMPVPIQLNHQVSFPFLQLFETQCEATTGATRQLSGNVTSSDNAQTATEFQGLQVVGNLILDRVVSLFNLFFKVPIIKKMALVTAMFNPEPQTDDGNPKNVAVQNDQGKREFKPVTAAVQYGNYNYKIDDNKAELERKQNAQQMIQLVQQMLQDPELNERMKKVDVSVRVIRDLGYQDAPSWFMNDEELVMKQLQIEAIKERTALMIGQMQQNLRAEVLSENGVDPNAPIPQAGVAGPGQPPVPPTANPSNAANPGMGDLSAAPPGIPGLNPGVPVQPGPGL